MVMFWRKKSKIENMLTGYFDSCDQCVDLFKRALAIYFEKGLGAEYDSAANDCHEAESAADDQRREIELTLYGKALLPNSRGDLLGLLEAFDRLPNVFETLAYILSTQQIEIPPPIVPDIKELVDINLEAYYLARKSIDALFNNPRITLHATKDVDEKESESDRKERAIIKKLFASDIDKADKLCLRDLVLLVGDISDRAERAADRIGIVAIKRQI